METSELLKGDPKTWPGAHKLLAALKVASELLAQEIDREIHRTPVPPSNVQADIDSKQRRLKALDERVTDLGGRSGDGEIVKGFEERALERLFEVGIRKERDLASDLGVDAWDVAAWCDEASDEGLIERMGTSYAPQRHWVILDKGHEQIGHPSTR